MTNTNETKKLEILVVEDAPEHLEDVQRFYAGRIEKAKSLGVELKVDYASTYNDAMEKLSKGSYNGLCSDLHFPLENGGAPELNGIKLGEYARDKSLGVVFTTDLYMHGLEMHATLNDIEEKFCGRKVFHYNPNSEKKDGTKLWKVAYIALLADIRGKSKNPGEWDESCKKKSHGIYCIVRGFGEPNSNPSEELISTIKRNINDEEATEVFKKAYTEILELSE